MQTSQAAPGSSWHEVNATRVFASALGVLAGLSGLDHGFFETLQGNASTPGLFVQSIGPAQRMWLYGTEDAFTLVPNFLATGILAMAVGVLIIVWSIGFIDRGNGSRVFLLLGALLFLVGGGVAQVGFVPGVTDPNQLQAICWSALGLMLGVLLLAIVGGFAHDIEREADRRAPAGTSR